MVASNDSENYEQFFLLTGLLRKKGLILHNERLVKVSPEGVLTYYHLDHPTVAKDKINLKHSSIVDIKFVYAGRWPANHSKESNKN